VSGARLNEKLSSELCLTVLIYFRRCVDSCNGRGPGSRFVEIGTRTSRIYFRRQMILYAVCLMACCTSTFAQKEKGESIGGQNQRRLYGERIRGAQLRGGEGAVAKSFSEFTPMKNRAAVSTPTAPPDKPTVGPVPTPAPDTEVTVGGCRFVDANGTVTTFKEGESMGNFAILAGCANGSPEDYPCICSSGAPDQTLCPYCTFEGASGGTICAKDNSSVWILNTNTSAPTTCSCSVSMELSKASGIYSVSIFSNCKIDDVSTGESAPTVVPASPGQDSLAPTIVVTTVSSPSPTTEAPTTTKPTSIPTRAPITNTPTINPTKPPTTTKPTSIPTKAPTTRKPTNAPTSALPTQLPTDVPSASPADPTLVLGKLVTVENGMTLSEGLSSRLIATTNQTILYGTGVFSALRMHGHAAGGDTFVDTRPGNPGGWVYLSGRDEAVGGVAALTFNKDGQVIDYEMILEETVFSSNGGRTPWNTWVTGEREVETLKGRVYQLDPMGIQETALLTMSGEGGAYGGFTFDIRKLNQPHFFLSEDFVFGCIRKFTPIEPDWNNAWEMLHGEGLEEYLLLNPDESINGTVGTYSWTRELMLAKGNAARNYPEAQGISVHGSTLTFVCKGIKKMFQLNLDGESYTMTSTTQGLFQGEPSEIRYVVGDESRGGQTLLYMTESNGRRPGVHALTLDGKLYTLLIGLYKPNTAGFALSPNGKFMYVSFKDEGLLYSIERTDGLSFFDKMLLNDTVDVSKKSITVSGEVDTDISKKSIEVSGDVNIDVSKKSIEVSGDVNIDVSKKSITVSKDFSG
jgi:hypothetical protein